MSITGNVGVELKGLYKTITNSNYQFYTECFNVDDTIGFVNVSVNGSTPMWVTLKVYAKGNGVITAIIPNHEIEFYFNEQGEAYLRNATSGNFVIYGLSINLEDNSPYRGYVTGATPELPNAGTTNVVCNTGIGNVSQGDNIGYVLAKSMWNPVVVSGVGSSVAAQAGNSGIGTVTFDIPRRDGETIVRMTSSEATDIDSLYINWPT